MLAGVTQGGGLAPATRAHKPLFRAPQPRTKTCPVSLRRLSRSPTTLHHCCRHRPSCRSRCDIAKNGRALWCGSRWCGPNRVRFSHSTSARVKCQGGRANSASAPSVRTETCPLCRSSSFVESTAVGAEVASYGWRARATYDPCGPKPVRFSCEPSSIWKQSANGSEQREGGRECPDQAQGLFRQNCFRFLCRKRERFSSTSV